MSHIFERLQYHTEINHSANTITYLNKLSPLLNENSYLTYAYLLQNPNLTEEERKVYQKCFDLEIEKEKKISALYFSVSEK